MTSVETPTHTVFIGEVIAGSDTSKGVPMTYDYYHKVIKGSAPRNAPTYRAAPPAEDHNDGEEWVCTVCGYVYNDPDISLRTSGGLGLSHLRDAEISLQTK